MVQTEKMPPDDPLPGPERRILLRWIEAGAPGLAGARPAGHWAFRPLVRGPIPAVSRGQLARTAVDPFILAALGAKGLAPGPGADRATLLRRVSFDLTRLPPGPRALDP